MHGDNNDVDHTSQPSGAANSSAASSTLHLPSIYQDKVPRVDGSSREFTEDDQISKKTEKKLSPGALPNGAQSKLNTPTVVNGGSTPDRLPKLNPKEHSLTAGTNSVSDDKAAATSTTAHRPSEFEKRLDEMLKRGGPLDNGMKSRSRSGGKGNRKGGKNANSKRGAGGGGGGGGGKRPLGDIVSPRRMQELLHHEDDRMLPYTYYRTAVNSQEPNIENTNPNTPQ
jgi:hypothetical protein